MMTLIPVALCSLFSRLLGTTPGKASEVLSDEANMRRRLDSSVLRMARRLANKLAYAKPHDIVGCA